MTTYDWNTMVTVTVPEGLNGWKYTGKVKINGRVYKFPVGRPAQVPEPVAKYIESLMAKEAAELAKNPNGYASHQVFVTDAAGNPVWEEKPFYAEVAAEEVANESVTIDKDGGYTRIQSYTSYQFDVGEKYKVVFEGTEYECVAWKVDGKGWTALGNGDILGVSGYGNGEPFAIDAYEDGDIYLNMPTAGTYSIIMKHIAGENVYPLDEKYLPPVVPKRTVAEIIPVTTLECTQYIGISNPFKLSLVLGEEYKVLWDGTEYVLNAETGVDKSTVALQHSAFTITTKTGGEWVSFTPLVSGTHTISISKLMVMDEDIPNTIMRVGGSGGGWDAVIDCTNEDSEYSVAAMRYTTGSFETLIEKIRNGENIKVCLRSTFVCDDGSFVYQTEISSFCAITDEGWEEIEMRGKQCSFERVFVAKPNGVFEER